MLDFTKMLDFTIKTYVTLLKRLKEHSYNITPFESFLNRDSQNVVTFRHDVDRLPNNSLKIAKLEAEVNIESSYYFRTKAVSFDKRIIKKIADLDHEIGYHYENMDTCNGNIDKAWDDFRRNLEKLRELYPVKTICMHGSPLSKYDNRDLWKKYDYKSEGIIGEPYFDIDFDEVFYLTDTGRRWDGGNVSIRDKVESDENMDWSTYSSTFDIIEAVERGTFPDKAMINVHPQRWHDFGARWVKELVWQNVKNVGKYFLAKYRDG